MADANSAWSTRISTPHAGTAAASTVTAVLLNETLVGTDARATLVPEFSSPFNPAPEPAVTSPAKRKRRATTTQPAVARNDVQERARKRPAPDAPQGRRPRAVADGIGAQQPPSVRPALNRARCVRSATATPGDATALVRRAAAAATVDSASLQQHFGYRHADLAQPQASRAPATVAPAANHAVHPTPASTVVMRPVTPVRAIFDGILDF